MKTRSLRRAAALLLALALACSLLTLPAEAAPAITFDPPSLDLDFNESNEVSVKGAPEDATVYWYSTDESVAKVSPSYGPVSSPVKITAQRKAGNATIYVIINGDRYGYDDGKGCSVTVAETPVKVTGLTLNAPTAPIEMKTDGTWTLTATPQPANATIKKIEWSSNPPTAVDIETDSDGRTAKLTAKEAGKGIIITVTATSTDTDNSTATNTCVLNIEQREDIERLTVSSTNVSLVKGGEPEEITVTVEGKRAADGIDWTPKSHSLIEKIEVDEGTTPDANDPYTMRYTLTITANPNAKIDNNDPTNNQFTVTVKANGNPAFYDSDSTKYKNFFVATVSDTPTPQPEDVYISGPSIVDPGSTIQLTASPSPAGANPTITWTSDNTSVASVASVTYDGLTATVTGESVGSATITAQAGSAKGSREIETSGILLSYRPAGEASAKSIPEGGLVDLYQYHDLTVLTEAFGNAKGKQVTLTTSNTAVASVDDTLRVTANTPGESKITALVTGTGFSATFTVKVSEDTADAINVSMGSSASYSFSGLLSELDKRSQSKAGGPLESVSNLKVSTENGVLYYGYTSPESPGQGVGGSQRFYYQPGQTQLALKNVSFVPLPGFDGTAIVEYTGMTSNGSTFNGTIRIEANASGDVTYSTEVNQPVAFAAEHFSAVCLSRTGQSVRYVNFSQPAASRGTLYYNYSSSGQYSPKVESSTAYYVSGTPSIDGVSFVPAEGFKGSVSIPYRCIDSSGAGYTGTVTVTVGGGAGGAAATGDVEYSVARNQRQAFRAADFNRACQSVIGGTLDYIRFTSLPASTAGILYLNYTSSSSTRVAASRRYYRNSSPYISDISFVPATNYSGTVTIPFTAANTAGDTFSGTLVIHVVDGVGTVRYSTSRNQSVSFAAGDFNSASRRINGTSLNYVRFTGLPSSSAGILYQNYVNSSSVRVATGRSYYRSGSPSLSSITFVPASGYSGSVTIPFTAYDDNGDTFTGTVTIQVYSGSSAASSSIRYTGSSAPVPFRVSDFQSVCQTMLGNPLSYVQFTSLPAVGQLNQNYGGPAQTGAGVNTTTHYGSLDLDQISYLPKAEYQGFIYIPYTLYDTQGAAHSSSVEIQISKDYSYSSFADIPSGYWASPSIEFLRWSGITNGYGNNTYRPAQSISRGEFTLMICRAFQFPTTGSSGFPDVPANSTYAGAVASARDLGIVEGNNGLFQPDRPITRQSAMTMICRALDAAGQAVPIADTGLLSSYADGGQISAFARSSVASLVQMGVVQGNNSNRLNPSAAISRAEMAVILHRVLTR